MELLVATRNALVILVDALFSAEHEHLQKTADELVEANNALQGGAYSGIIKNAQTIMHSNVRGSFATTKLHASLTDSVLTYLNNSAMHLRDRSRVMQIMFPWLVNANSVQEIRDAIPDCWAALVPVFTVIPRVNSLAQLANAIPPMHSAQFDEIQPLIQFYAASHLIF